MRLAPMTQHHDRHRRLVRPHGVQHPAEHGPAVDVGQRLGPGLVGEARTGTSRQHEHREPQGSAFHALTVQTSVGGYHAAVTDSPKFTNRLVHETSP